MHGGTQAALPTLGSDETDRDALFDSIFASAIEAGIVPAGELAPVDPTALRYIPRQLRGNAELSPRSVGSRYNTAEVDRSKCQRPLRMSITSSAAGFTSPTNGWGRCGSPQPDRD